MGTSLEMFKVGVSSVSKNSETSVSASGIVFFVPMIGLLKSLL